MGRKDISVSDTPFWPGTPAENIHKDHESTHGTVEMTWNEMIYLDELIILNQDRSKLLVEKNSVTRATMPGFHSELREVSACALSECRVFGICSEFSNTETRIASDQDSKNSARMSEHADEKQNKSKADVQVDQETNITATAAAIF